MANHSMRSSHVIDVDALDVEALDVDSLPNHAHPSPIPTPSPPRRPRRKPMPKPQSQSMSANTLPRAPDVTGPNPDVHALFAHYNEKHFNSALTNVYVEFSTRMTLCAGTCTYRGRAGGCRIALSEPLLKLRPTSDLRSTLLHEMIHAHLFNKGISRDGPDGHGPLFMEFAERINIAEPPDIRVTPYHTFNSEVEHYRTHHWKCARCAMLIKRAMNRPPGAYDVFWEKHVRNCGGSFDKIREPPKKQKPPLAPKRCAIAVDKKTLSEPKAAPKTSVPKGVMLTFRIDDMLSGKPEASNSNTDCPVCGISVSKLRLNHHLDKCLSDDFTNDVVEVEVTQISPVSKSTTGKPKSSVAGLNGDAIKAPTFFGTAAAPSNVQTKSTAGGVTSTGFESRRTAALPDRAVHEPEYSKALTPTQDAYKHGRTSSSGVIDVDDGVTDKCMQFAINPRAFGETQTRQLVDSLRCDEQIDELPLAKKAKTSFSQLLHPVLHGRRELEDARLKRTGVQPLKISSAGGKDGELSFVGVGRRLGVPHTDVYDTLREQCREDGDGSLVVPDDFEDLVLSTRRGAHPTSSFDRVGGGPSLPPAGSVVGSNRNAPEKGEQIGNCPVCDMKVARSKLEAHVNECLDGSNLRDAFHTQPPEDQRQGAASVADGRGDGLAVGPAKTDFANCPICDSVIPRSRLEAHVNSCLMSTGLDDAF